MSGRDELQAITFSLGREMYGIEVRQIKEIIKVREYVRVPRAPDFVEGVINLRGQITPILNLRKIFGIEQRPVNEDSRIIMVEMESEVVGLIVDSVVGVVTIPLKDVVRPPALTSKDNDIITGIIRTETQLIILIDVIKLLDEVKANHSKLIKETVPTAQSIEASI